MTTPKKAVTRFAEMFQWAIAWIICLILAMIVIAAMLRLLDWVWNS